MAAVIVVYLEHSGGNARRASLEALGAASGSGQTVVAAVGGAGADAVAADLGRWGADRVVVFSGGAQHSPDRTARDIAALARKEGAKACLAAATSSGKDVLPRVAALLDSTCFTDCTRFEWSDSGPRAVRPILAGKAIATFDADSPVFCASLRPNNFSTVERDASAEIASVQSQAEAAVEVIEIAAKSSDKLDVKEAPVVVSGGRGLKEAANFNLIEDLAAAFGNAAVGASRAVVDAGWRPHAEQVGQTGKTVSPQLYVAVGISGAIQHLAGMRTSKVIVAINTDADAPIFTVADYGVVGDALEIVPALTAAVKQARAARQ